MTQNQFSHGLACGNPVEKTLSDWIPAFAGMTISGNAARLRSTIGASERRCSDVLVETRVVSLEVLREPRTQVLAQ